MVEEFKTFASHGNVVDLAVGVIIGAIVASAVQDVLMPIIGAATGGLDFSNYYIPLSSKVQAGTACVQAKQHGAVIGCGQFITVAINLLIVAFVMFMVIRAMNGLRTKSEAKPETVADAPADVKILGEIRYILAVRTPA